MVLLLLVASAAACFAAQVAATPAGDQNGSSVRQCAMVKSISVDFACRATVESCGPQVPSGTIIRSSCKPGHSSSTELEELKCIDGRWDRPTPKCHAVCGLENKPSRLRRIVNGADAVRGAFPWHVAIYQDLGGEITYICGGTLLQTNVIISAAHCFYDPVKSAVNPATDYKIAIGKMHRAWDSEDERDLEGVQKSEIKQIFVHERYVGDEGNQQFDVGLLELATPVHISATVRPICVDLVNEEFDKHQLEVSNIGKIAGWGVEENGLISETLRTLNVPVIGFNECRQEMSKYKFTRYLTTDKLCAGYTNGSSLCRGDTGGGLVFPAEGEKPPTRWFLRAIASNGPLSDDFTSCRWNSYTAYTHIFKLKDWISRQLRTLSDPS